MAPSSRAALANGGGGAGSRDGEAEARSQPLCRLWVPRNFRTLPESFQSVKCRGEVGCGGARNREVLRWGRRPSGSCQFLEADGLASDRNPSYLMISLVERRLLRGLFGREDIVAFPKVT